METESSTFKTIFPKYSKMVREGDFQPNENIEQYIRNELPLQVEVIKKM